MTDNIKNEAEGMAEEAKGAAENVAEESEGFFDKVMDKAKDIAENVGEVVSGRERFPINVRYPREIRDSLERLRTLPFVTEKGAQLLLQDVAQVRVEEGPPMLRSEKSWPCWID